MNIQRSLTALKIAPSRQKIETREEKNIDRLSGYINDSLNHPVEHQEQKSGFFFDALFFFIIVIDGFTKTHGLAHVWVHARLLQRVRIHAHDRFPCAL
ncbi:hypothetical protein CEXT_547241 [Caerostris extrusa]|uniref:Uncharacterized protein n=1 Tax=Caerostris extrusa TaxID=172846 RepID=A0AAV4VJN9_CAEEX|nr:hypothetical protein CEXT_547241 [Caerostris extrusa]